MNRNLNEIAEIREPRLQQLKDELFHQKNISVYALRLDEIHPEINGNKFFKLKYNIEEAGRQNKKCLLTFGGAYSNHIYAAAAAGKYFGLETIGIIRGNELHENSNEQLAATAKNGMRLKFVSRDDYRLRSDDSFIQKLKEEFGDFYLVPEGGSNLFAVKGAAEITSFIDTDFNFICCASGTGGTIAGISTSLLPHQKVLGITVVNAQNYFEKQIAALSNKESLPENILLNHNFHFGGYAKGNEELNEFRSKFIQKHQMKIDSVYNAKLFYAVYKLAEENFFESGDKIICLNTGGY